MADANNITLRSEKTQFLTFEEMDLNLDQLKDTITEFNFFVNTTYANHIDEFNEFKVYAFDINNWALNAENYKNLAKESSIIATAKADEALLSASSASNSAYNANQSASQAANSASLAAASYDSFDDRYLGAKSSNPSTDNDGQPLITGALYWNLVSNSMRSWTGSAWVETYVANNGYVLKTGDVMTGSLQANAFIGNGSQITDISATNITSGELDSNLVEISNYPTIRPSLLLDFANSKTVDPRIAFTRASAAGYFDDKGIYRQAVINQPRIDHDPVTGECKGLLIEESRTNLLAFSEHFDNAAWTKFRLTVTANAIIAPDGKLTGDKLVEDTTANNSHSVNAPNYPATNTTITATVYAKAAGRTQFLLGISNFSTGFGGAVFDLSTGVAKNLTNTGDYTNTSASIAPVGDGWYRCSVTTTKGSFNSVNRFIIELHNGSTTQYTGDGTSGVYVWGTQLEAGSFHTSYIPTPATFTSRASEGKYTDSAGLLKTAAINEPRYDHGLVDGVWVPKGLLLELQRTNLLTYSEQFDNAVWFKQRATISTNSIIAPDGTTTADKLVEDTTVTSTHHIEQSNLTVVSGAIYAASICIKASERSKVRITYISGASGVYADADLGSGVIGIATAFNNAVAGSSSIKDLGGDWYRCSVSGSQSAGTSGGIRVEILDATGNRIYTGDGTSGIYIWGAQLEEIPAGQSPEPSSPIKTEATAVTRSADVSTSSAVTRATDSAVMTGENFSSWFRNDQGSIYAETDALIPDSGIFIIGRSISSYTPRIQVSISNQGLPNFAVIDDLGNLAVSLTSLGNKVAVAYKNNDFAQTANGEAVALDSAGLIPTGLTGIVIGALLTTSGKLNGHIAKLAYYPKRLANNELQALTAE